MKITDFLSPQDWLDENSGPRYKLLQRRIEEGIETSLLQPNSPLPPEREIASLTGLSRVTVRKAMQALVEKGAIVQLQGSGSYVADSPPRVEQSLSRLTSFTEDMALRGMDTSSVWLERGLFRPTQEEYDVLGLSKHDSVSRLARLRLSGERPLAIERASLPQELLPNPTLVTRSLYEVLALDENRPERAVQKISAVNLNDDDADLLGVTPGVAGLKIERISYLPDGRVAELTRSIYRGDAYDFVAELRISPLEERK